MRYVNKDSETGEYNGYDNEDGTQVKFEPDSDGSYIRSKDDDGHDVIRNSCTSEILAYINSHDY